MAFTRHGVVFCDAKMSPKTYNQKHTPQKTPTSTGLCFSSKKQHVSPKKKPCHGYFSIQKLQNQPNPPKPPNRPTTKPQQPIHPLINSPTPQESPQEFFPTHGPMLRRWRPEELGANEKATGKFITCRCQRCKGRDATFDSGGRVWMDMDQMVIGSVG